MRKYDARGSSADWNDELEFATPMRPGMNPNQSNNNSVNDMKISKFSPFQTNRQQIYNANNFTIQPA